MPVRTASVFGFVILALLLAAACSPSAAPTVAPSPEPAMSRQDVLVSLSDRLIIPRFQRASEQMNGLRAALDALCAGPTPATLNAARTAWREARGPWLRSQAMWFGPVMDRRSRSIVAWEPVEPDRIEATLAKRDAVSAHDVREFFGATQRGLGAVEYVIFGDEAAALASLDDPAGIRCQYLTALGETMADEVAAVALAWRGDGSAGDGYGAYFSGDASIALVEQQAVDEAVRTSVFLTRSIADMRLGKALGIDGAHSDPEAIPGGAGHNAVADLRHQVLGMQDVYLGGDAEGALGISVLVRGVSAEADARMRDHFAATLAAIDLMQEPLQTTLATDPGPTQVVHRQMQELQRALNTEVVSLLGVTVGFADTDGDGG